MFCRLFFVFFSKILTKHAKVVYNTDIGGAIMLVMFKFKNYGPFKEETTFDMRAIKSYKEHPYNLITECDDCNLLKVVAIYGANASGKQMYYKHLII